MELETTIERAGVELDVTVIFDYSYDAGCWRTANGDGWPESEELDICAVMFEDVDISQTIPNADMERIEQECFDMIANMGEPECDHDPREDGRDY